MDKNFVCLLYFTVMFIKESCPLMHKGLKSTSQSEGGLPSCSGSFHLIGLDLSGTGSDHRLKKRCEGSSWGRVAKICFCLKWTGTSSLGVSGISFLRPCIVLLALPAVRRGIAFCTHYFVKHALVQWSLCTPALIQLVIVILEAVPMSSEFLETVGTHVLYPDPSSSAKLQSNCMIEHREIRRNLG